MALNKLKYNSLNVTPVANKAISFDSDPDALEATLSGGAMTFIKKLTASSDSTLSFVNGSSDVVLDNTYKEYIFIFKDIHGSQDNAFFQVGFRDGGSDYDAVKTSSFFKTQHTEDDVYASVDYHTASDLAQSTSFQYLSTNSGNDNDQCVAGYLHLFNPSSTTFVKHFIAQTNLYHFEDGSMQNFIGGYCNTTTAIDGAQFKFSGGTIDAGTITLYGIN